MGSASAITSSDPFARRFALTAAERRAALVVYITAGHPDMERSLELLRALPSAGADIIEVGVPFSDPMADGPIIQASSQRALEQGMTFDRVLALVRDARVDVPMVLFTYLNPLLTAGEDALDRAHDAGVSGLLVTDLPLGADRELEERFARGPLSFVRLVAPTTPADRMAEIATHGGGFVYLISRLGVTGVRNDVPIELPATIRMLRAATALPICVGFGISTPAQARAVAAMADGVVVGSAVVRAADQSPGAAIELVGQLRAALDR
ncbi:MAG TPA: tryptophan synthase subunit alpha, partial [Gemmatimonadaceae bacterium]|nr:tryptophan synthase subunit alpha [Gemmatimonadaceae bacterium]